MIDCSFFQTKRYLVKLNSNWHIKHKLSLAPLLGEVQWQGPKSPGIGCLQIQDQLCSCSPKALRSTEYGPAVSLGDMKFNYHSILISNVNFWSIKFISISMKMKSNFNWLANFKSLPLCSEYPAALHPVNTPPKLYITC